jgi:poly-beta-1,6-N-acetyl-D-glucosamine synthase
VSPLTYAVVTPAKDEADRLAVLARSLTAQSVPPRTWLIVDNGSTDQTPAVIAELGRRHPWIHALSVQPVEDIARGAPIVRAFHAGIGALGSGHDIVAKVDADITLEPDYFERLLDAFAADSRLGIASGTCYELQNGSWRQRFGTGANVWGAARAYRAECLAEVLPFEERIGWDGVDVIKANVRGWRTATLLDLPFRHHRLEAAREQGRWHGWSVQGDAAHFMGYRFAYLVLRTLFHARKDPFALGMLWGYAVAGLRRRPPIADPSVREYVRREQRLRDLPMRRREALGTR